MRNISHSLILFAAMMLVGCNDDIFVKPVPEVENIVLSGHGGRATFKVDKKDLRGFYIDSPYYGEYSNTFFYNKEGEGMWAPFNIDDIAKITYTTPCCAIDFLIDGNEVTAIALDNTLSGNIHLNVTLDYGVLSSGFEIIVTPGDPMILENMGYSLTPIQTGTEVHTSPRTSLSNNTSLTQQLTIRPYAIPPTVLYDSSENWERGVGGLVSVPYYNNGEWLLPPEPNARIRIGYLTEYTPYGVDLDLTETVEVPPYTKTSVEVTVTYATCLTAYSCEMIMPASRISNMSWGTCRISQPIDYEIKKVCEKL